MTVWPQSATPSTERFGSSLAHFAGAIGSRLRRLGSARTLANLTWLVSIAGIVLIALLALRVWMQLMGETAAGGLMGLAYDASGVLASPFRSFEPTTPIRDNGILEFSTLVAIEAYLIATMVTLTVLFSARLAVMAAPRVVHRNRPIVLKDTAFIPVQESTKS